MTIKISVKHMYQRPILILVVVGNYVFPLWNKMVDHKWWVFCQHNTSRTYCVWHCWSCRWVIELLTKEERL